MVAGSLSIRISRTASLLTNIPKEPTMRFRNWLLTGTSLALLAAAPISFVRAQDATNPALVEAYKAFQAKQNGKTKKTLEEACIAAGFKGLDDCIAALS